MNNNQQLQHDAPQQDSIAQKIPNKVMDKAVSHIDGRADLRDMVKEEITDIVDVQLDNLGVEGGLDGVISSGLDQVGVDIGNVNVPDTLASLGEVGGGCDCCECMTTGLGFEGCCECLGCCDLACLGELTCAMLMCC